MTERMTGLSHLDIKHDEDPMPIPHPGRTKVRTWMPDEEVDLAIGESGIESEEPITVGQLFKNAVDRFSKHPALKYKEDGEWKSFTYTEYYDECIRAAKSFLKLGLEPKHGVAILGFNSPEWVISTLGAMFAGGLPAGIFATYNHEACHFVANNCRANIIVVENQKQLDKILEIRGRLPHLKAIVQYKGKLSQEYPNVHEWKKFLKLGDGTETNVVEEKMNSQKPNQCALLVYTPGTTGKQKGVMLSHDNLTFTAKAFEQTYGEMIPGQERGVSYLPLASIAAQMTDIYIPLSAGATVYFAQPNALNGSLVQTLREVQPTCFFGVPRVYEKIMEDLQEQFERFSTRTKTRGPKWNIQSPQADRNQLFFEKVREGLGFQHCKVFGVGSAPMHRRIHDYFKSIKMPLRELYGMSESSGPHTLSPIPQKGVHVGSCGRPIMGMKQKIVVDEQGHHEICLYGRHVFMGYLKDKEKTIGYLNSEETKTLDTWIDSDGWLHSGDIGKIEGDFLTITGRIKELIIMSSGDNIPPVPIENRIKDEIPFLSNVMVVGDERQFLTCLMTLKCTVDNGKPQDTLTPEAQRLIKACGSRNTKMSKIVADNDPAVSTAIWEGLEKANKFATSEQYCVQKWTFLSTDFSIPGGELGPTLKLKRHFVKEMYKKRIESMYSGEQGRERETSVASKSCDLQVSPSHESKRGQTSSSSGSSVSDDSLSPPPVKEVDQASEIGQSTKRTADEVNCLSSAVNKAKQLGVQFIDPVEIISCDTLGCNYYNRRHDVGVTIPEGAILPSDGMVKFEFGVAMYGPFKLVDGISVRRVSPVVWLCAQEDGFSGFQKDVEITIPHFLDFSTEDAYKYLRFLKADHLNEDGKIEYQLKPATGTAVFDHASDATHGKLLTRLFCSLCIATSVFCDKHIKYCLGGELSLTAQGRQIIFYVCYFLKSCVKTVQQHLDEDSEKIYQSKIHPTDFMFIDGKELKINHNELPGWLVATESSEKISAKQVDFQGMSKNELILKERLNLYPPRFVVKISASSTAEDSKVVFTFEGATEEIVKEIILTKAISSPLTSPSLGLERVNDTTLLDVDHYLSICEKVIQEQGKGDQTIMHCIFLGAAGVGKSTVMKRLLGEKVDIASQTSTQIAEKSVRVVSTAVAEVSDVKWRKIDDNAVACGLMGQMVTEQEMGSKEANQKEHKQKSHLEMGNASEQAPSQKEDSTQASVKVQKDEQLSAVNDANKQVSEQTVPVSKQNTSKQQERVPDDSQAANSTNDSQASKSKSQQLQSTGFLRHVLETEGVSGVKKYINNPQTIYLTDSGGQPEFRELLPAIVVGPCIFIVVLPLDKDLKKKYEVKYVRPGKHMQTYSSSLTMEEELLCSLSSIASTKYKDETGKEVKQLVMLVATFIDKVPQMDRQKKLDDIEALVKETDAYKQDMIVCTSDDEAEKDAQTIPPAFQKLDKKKDTRNVFTINNASDYEAEKDAQTIRDAFQKFAERFKVPTPYSWLIFSILVQDKDYGSVICYKTCFELAQDCRIKDEREFEAALEFLHRQTGILHYHKQPSELRQIVICDPQYLFSRVNQLVEETFIPDKAVSEKCIEDFKKGLFKREHYDELTKQSSSSELTPSMLLKLLVHLNVVAPLDCDGESYFMPCAITHLKPSAVGLPQPAVIPPLLITFKSGYCPKGLFGSLVACIAKSSKLNLDKSNIHRDQICFTMNRCSLLLRVSPPCIYFEVNPGNTVEPLSVLCNGFRKMIFNSIDQACLALHYSLTAHTDYFLSFEGWCNQCKKLHPLQTVLKVDHSQVDPLQVDSFQCNESQIVVEPILRWYIWLPEPFIQSDPEEKVVVAPGTNVTFKIEATGDRLKFKWQKDRKTDLSDDEKYCDTDTDTLHIVEVEKGDKGRYRCHVTNYTGEKFSKEVFLTVIDPPRISQHPESKSVATGASTTLTVEASGDNLHFQWMKDGKDLHDRRKYRDTKTHTLRIKDVEKSGIGSYQCLVMNDVGKQLSEEADLAVIDPPKIIQHPESKSVATGASTTLTVEVSGDNLCFQWRKDGKDLRDGNKYCCTKTHTLHIKDVEKSDKGSYQCLVKNDVREELSEKSDLAVTVLNVQNLSSELVTVINWYILGLNLGLPKHELDTIERDYQGNDRRRVEMLDLWLQHTPNATWNDVIRALEQMGENRVAKNIRQICGEGFQ